MNDISRKCHQNERCGKCDLPLAVAVHGVRVNLAVYQNAGRLFIIPMVPRYFQWTNVPPQLGFHIFSLIMGY